MKSKIVFLGLAFLLYSGYVSAQGLKIGGKIGASLYKIDDVSFSDQVGWGYHAGGFIEAMWSKTMGIQPEVIFNQSNTKTATSFDQLYQGVNPGILKDVKLNYLSIPVLLNFKPITFVTFQAGPQFSLLMSKEKTLLQNGQAAFKSNNVSMLAGVQLNLFQFRIYGRYGIGLTNENNINTQDKWNNRGIQVGAGITF